MKKIVMSLTAVMCLSIILSACSDPKKASEANFKTSIQAAVESVADGKYCFMDARFPKREIGMGTMMKNQNREIQNQRLATLESAGILSSKMVDQPFSKVELKEYDLTEQGKALVTTEKVGSRRSAEKLCIGKIIVTKITNFTEPSNAFGQTMSQVQYDLEVTDLPSWAKGAKFQEAFPESLGKMAKGESLQGKIALVLTNNGWVWSESLK